MLVDVKIFAGFAQILRIQDIPRTWKPRLCFSAQPSTALWELKVGLKYLILECKNIIGKLVQYYYCNLSMC